MQPRRRPDQSHGSAPVLDDGAHLLPYASRTGHLILEVKRAAMDGPLPAGRLCVGSPETTTALRLPPILTASARAHPQVDIELHTGTTASLVDDVLERRLEGAFVAGPVDHPDLAEETIVEEELVLLSAPWIPSLEALTRLVAARAIELKILVLRAGCSYRQRLERFLAGRGIVDIRRLEFGTVDGIVECVSAGIGVTLLPRAVIEPARREGRVAGGSSTARTGAPHREPEPSPGPARKNPRRAAGTGANRRP